jgi:hypothetical protein
MMNDEKAGKAATRAKEEGRMKPSPPGRRLIDEETQSSSPFLHLPCCTTGLETGTYQMSFLEECRK